MISPELNAKRLWVEVVKVEEFVDFVSGNSFVLWEFSPQRLVCQEVFSGQLHIQILKDLVLCVV